MSNIFFLTLVELKYAIEVQGYKLLNVYEVLFYPKYSLTLFENFLKTFYMAKVGSKGEHFMEKNDKKYLGSPK